MAHLLVRAINDLNRFNYKRQDYLELSYQVYLLMHEQCPSNQMDTSRNCQTMSDKWKELYNLNLTRQSPKDLSNSHRDLSLQTLHPFGKAQHFRARKVGPFHVINNSTYARKEGSPLIDQAEKEKRITIPHSINPKFKGFPLEQVIAYINLDNVSLIWPTEHMNKMTHHTPHFLLFKTMQVCTDHSLLVFNADKNEPQILREELILFLLQVSGIIPRFTFGYNSQGAASTLNVFHLQYLSHQDLTCGQPFHFQNLEGFQIKRVQLIEKGGESGGACLLISIFEFLGAIFVRIKCQGLPLSHSSIIKEVAAIIYSIVEVSFRLVVPHNINFPNQHEFYLIFRSFATPQTRFGWVEYSGVFKTCSDQQFQTISEKEIEKVYEKLALGEEVKKNINRQIRKVLAQ